MGKRTTEYDRQRSNLAKLMLVEKQFSFSIADIGFKVDELIKKGILEQQNGKLVIRHFTDLAEPSMIYLKSFYGFKPTNDLDKFLRFIHQIQHHLDGQGFLNGRSSLQSKLIIPLIVGWINDSKGDIKQLCERLDTSDNIYELISALENALPDLNIETDRLISLLLWLFSKVGEQEYGIVNADLINLGKAIGEVSRRKPELGRELFARCILANPQLLRNFHANIMAGLVEQDFNFITEIDKIKQQVVNQQNIVASMSMLKFDNETPFDRMIALIESIQTEDLGYLAELPRFYVKILASEFNLNQNLKDHCKLKLDSLALLKNPVVTRQLFLELKFIKGNEDYVREQLTRFVGSEEFGLAHCKGLSEICLFRGDVELLFRLIGLMIEKLKGEFPLDHIDHAVTAVRWKNPVLVDQMLINLMIDNNGLKRMWGFRLLNRVNRRDHKGFDMDILQLSALEQYKLCISLTEDLSEPRQTLPYLVRLLKSPYHLVAQLANHKIEHLAENYGTEVLNILEKTLDQSNLEYLAKIETHLKAFDENLEKKSKIKELDPRFSQSKYLLQFYKSKQKSMDRSMELNEDKDSFLSMIDTVHLMKGGGFKNAESEEISKLGVVNTTMRLPREYLLAPEQFDWQRKVSYSENWEHKFKKWEAIISS